MDKIIAMLNAAKSGTRIPRSAAEPLKDYTHIGGVINAGYSYPVYIDGLIADSNAVVIDLYTSISALDIIKYNVWVLDSITENGEPRRDVIPNATARIERQGEPQLGEQDTEITIELKLKPDGKGYTQYTYIDK